MYVDSCIQLGVKMDLLLLYLCAANGLVNAVYTLMGPFYPSVASDKGVSPMLVGIIFCVLPAAGFVTSFFLGEYLDRLSRKGALVLGLLLQAGAMGLVAWADCFGSWMFVSVSLISRLLSGVSMTLVEVSSFALIACVYPESVESNISLLEASTGLGMMLGPVVSGFLYDFVGFMGIFYGMAGVFLIVLPGAVFISEPARNDVEQKMEVSVLQLLMVREVILDMLVITYVILCISAVDAFVSMYLRSLGLSIFEMSFAFAVDPFTFLVCCCFYSRKLTSLNLTRVMQTGTAAAIFATLLMGLAYSQIVSIVCVLVGLGVLAIGTASTYIPGLPHMMQAAGAVGYVLDDKLNDVLSSLISAAYSLGEFLGPLIGGMLLTWVNFRVMVIAIGVAGVLILLAYISLYRVHYSLIPSDSQDSASILPAK